MRATSTITSLASLVVAMGADRREFESVGDRDDPIATRVLPASDTGSEIRAETTAGALSEADERGRGAAAVGAAAAAGRGEVALALRGFAVGA